MNKLTQPEITNRQVDALVAEKVMGWTHRGTHPIHQTEVWATGHSDTMLPRFTEDLASAWKVVGRIQELNLVDRFMDNIDQMSDAAGMMASRGRGLEWFLFECVAVPLAICKAALEAVKS